MAVTYNELYLNARRRLREIGVTQDMLEARELVCYAVDKTRSQFLMDRNLYATSDKAERVEELLRQRLTGQPLAHIIGEWEFYGIPLIITPDVLIPRSDTETVAEQAILRAREAGTSCRVLDLCTGSGCIGLAVAKNVPGSRVVLADLSEGAIRIAKQNIRRNNLTASVSCMKADAMEPPSKFIGSFNVIVSNPPYIRAGEREDLDPSVRDFEPWMALDGGEDGLRFYRTIAREWKEVLRPGGWLVFEVGYDQADDVERILMREGFGEISSGRDPNGNWRVVQGMLL